MTSINTTSKLPSPFVVIWLEIDRKVDISSGEWIEVDILEIYHISLNHGEKGPQALTLVPERENQKCH